MSTRDLLPDEDVLLRRFDPDHRVESYLDEGTGEYCPLPNAFQWDSEAPAEKGFSVYDDRILAAINLQPRDVVYGRWSAVAGASCGAIKALTRAGDGERLFTPRHDPFPEGSTLAIDEAHSVVWAPEPFGNDRRKLRENLVALFRPLPLTRAELQDSA